MNSKRDCRQRGSKTFSNVFASSKQTTPKRRLEVFLRRFRPTLCGWLFPNPQNGPGQILGYATAFLYALFNDSSTAFSDDDLAGSGRGCAGAIGPYHRLPDGPTKRRDSGAVLAPRSHVQGPTSQGKTVLGISCSPVSYRLAGLKLEPGQTCPYGVPPYYPQSF